MLGVVVAAAKINAEAGVLEHRAVAIGVFSLILLALLGGSPRAVALSAGPLLAFALAPPLWLGSLVAIGGSLALMTLFIGISTVLHVRQGRALARRGRLTGAGAGALGLAGSGSPFNRGA
jgi:hypothetical protein